MLQQRINYFVNITGELFPDQNTRILLLSALIGFIWGTGFTPLWNEMVESGLALSGAVDSFIPFAVTDFSLQITYPALLFKIGISPVFMAISTSGICVAMAFCAVSALSLILTPSRLSALITPVLLCKFPFYNFHYYPVKYPIYNYIFGQFGFYSATLAVGLLALGKRKPAFLLAGLMPAIHAPWALATWGFFLIYILLDHAESGQVKRSLNYLLAGLLISLLSGIYHQGILVPSFESKQNGYEESVLAVINVVEPEQIFSEMELVYQQEQSTTAPGLSDDEAGNISTESEFFLSRNENVSSGRSSHNLLFTDNPYPVLEAFKFFSIDIALFAALFFLCKFPQSGIVDTARLRHFVMSLFTFQCAVVAFKLIDEIDPEWHLLAFIHEGLPALLLRVIPNRFLNWDSLLFPVLFIAMASILSSQRRNLFAMAALLVLILIPWLPDTDGYNYSFSVLLQLLKFNLAGFFLAFLIITLVVLIPSLTKTTLPAGYSGKFIQPAILVLLISSIMIQGIKLHKTGDYLRSKDKEIVVATDGVEGALITAYGVQGYGNFNIFAQLQRPYYLTESRLETLPGFSAGQLDLFCNYGADGSYQARKDWQAECFALRKPETWILIGNYLNASQVITPSEYMLQLPLAGSSADFHVYDIK